MIKRAKTRFIGRRHRAWFSVVWFALVFTSTLTTNAWENFSMRARDYDTVRIRALRHDLLSLEPTGTARRNGAPEADLAAHYLTERVIERDDEVSRHGGKMWLSVILLAFFAGFAGPVVLYAYGWCSRR